MTDRATTLPRVTAIAAVARNGVIGRDNTLPWRLPEDLKHFKAATIGHTLVMGRKTFDSIGRPLPGRRTIVISRQAGWSAPGCETAGSLESALALAARTPEREVFIAGGGQIYQQAFQAGVIDRLLITEVDLDVAGDALFPAIDPARWVLQQRRPQVSAEGLGYAFVEYLRR